MMENLGLVSGTAVGLLPLGVYCVNSGLLERISRHIVLIVNRVNAAELFIEF